MHRATLIHLGALFAATACNSSSAPRLTGPATVSVEIAGPATASVGTSVAPVPVFIVRDSANRPLPNVLVSFLATGGSAVMPLSVETDEKGFAKPNSWILGPRAGSVSLYAAVGPENLNTFVTVLALAGAPTSISVTASTTSLALTDTATLASLVTDAQNNVVSAPAVTYTSSNPGVATISGNRVIAHAPGDALITAALTGTSLTGTVPVHVLPRFGHLGGRPFGIAYLGGQSPELLITNLDVNALTVVNASTYAVMGGAQSSLTPTDIAINASGTLAYVTAVDGTSITVVSLPGGAKQQEFSEGASARVLLSPDGTRLYVGRTGGFDVLSTATGAPLLSLQIDGQINGMAMLPDGSALWLGNPFTGKVYRFDTSTMALTDSATTGGAPQDIAFDQASGNVYVANESGWIDVLGGSHLSAVARFTAGAGFGARLTADGRKLVVSNAFAGSVYVMDRATGQVLKTVIVGGTPRRMTLLPDGRLAVANEGGWVDLITP